MRALLLGVGLLFPLAGVTWASCSMTSKAHECHYEWDASKRYPEEARKFGAGSAVRICTDNGRETETSFATPVTRGDRGVCYFWARDMNARVEGNRFPDRQLYMQLATKDCPRQDDGGYIENTNVPDGVFVELLRRWSGANRPNAKPFFPRLSDAEKRAGAVDFASVLKTPRGRSRFKLIAMDARSLSPDADPILGRSYGAAIGLLVSDSAKPSGTYYFAVDWVGGEFRVVSITVAISGC